MQVESINNQRFSKLDVFFYRFMGITVIINFSKSPNWATKVAQVLEYRLHKATFLTSWLTKANILAQNIRFFSESLVIFGIKIFLNESL